MKTNEYGGYYVAENTVNRVAENDVDGMYVHCDECVDAPERCSACGAEYERLDREYYTEMRELYGVPRRRRNPPLAHHLTKQSAP